VWATTFLSGSNWLRGEAVEDNLAIGRLLLIDRSAILVSTITADEGEEQALFGTGSRNGLVVIARRLLSQGLVPGQDPETN